MAHDVERVLAVDADHLGVAGMRHDAPPVVWKPRRTIAFLTETAFQGLLAAPALDAAAVEFGGNGAERLTGEALQDRPQHLVALGRRRHQLRIAKLLALRLLGSESSLRPRRNARQRPDECRPRVSAVLYDQVRWHGDGPRYLPIHC
jgi:hypothetical protein